MKKVVDIIKWLIRNFFPISIAVFVVVYIRWFRLTPLMFYNDPDYAYLVGVILLGVYSIFAFLFKLSKSNTWIRIFLFDFAILSLIGVAIHIYAFFPSVEDTAKCNEKTYFVTWMHPLGDYQWIFNNVTIWRNPFSYESFFLSYSGSYKIICDNKNNETHIVKTFLDRLAYTDSKEPRIYEDGAKLKNHQYGLSYIYNKSLDLSTYTIYECEIDFTGCYRIPFEYTGEYGRWAGYLESNEEKSELNVYFDVYHGTQSEDVLIFTYGEHPRCHVKGCEIK